MRRSIITVLKTDAEKQSGRCFRPHNRSIEMLGPEGVQLGSQREVGTSLDMVGVNVVVVRYVLSTQTKMINSVTTIFDSPGSRMR